MPCPEPEFRHRTDLYRREVLKRLHILCLALLAAATLGGCHRYLAREVRIVPKDVETYGSAGADVTLHGRQSRRAVRCGSKRRRCRSPTTAAKCCAPRCAIR